MKLSEGDILISSVGSWPDVPESVVGQVARVPQFLNGALLNQNIIRLENQYTGILDDYLFLIVNSVMFGSHVEVHAHGTANQASVKLKDILNFYVLMPPIEEQQQIIDFVNSQTRAINTAVNITNNEIALINEYRTRLIADVVTGKVDVRGLAFALPGKFEDDTEETIIEDDIDDISEDDEFD